MNNTTETKGETMQTEFVVLTSTAKMPSSCWGRYGNVALCEVEKGVRPKMISERARGMIRIVDYRGKLNEGKSERCAFMRAYRELEADAARLNAENNVDFCVLCPDNQHGQGYSCHASV